MTPEEKLKQFLDKVEDMRKAQKLYFQDRDQEVLKLSKRLEKEVDAMINDFKNPNLFS